MHPPHLQGGADRRLLDLRAGRLQLGGVGAGDGDPPGEPVLGVTADQLAFSALDGVVLLVVLRGLHLANSAPLRLVGTLGDPRGTHLPQRPGRRDRFGADRHGAADAAQGEQRVAPGRLDRH